MSGGLAWEREGQMWPHRASSEFVEAAGLRWHVQRSGSGPVILLLHGTGASVHSWHRLAPLLAERFTVLATDLPRHAFTSGRPQGGSTLPGFAQAIAGLLEAVDVKPALVVGHSAGAAIALQMATMKSHHVPVIGIGSAIMPFPGSAAHFFPTLAKLLFVNPLVPRLFSGAARVSGGTERFLKRATGSRVDPVSARCYAKLFGNSAHCAGALDMMAHWDLEGLRARFSAVRNPVLLLHGVRDATIPLSAVEEASTLLPHATLQTLPALGHLAHEEAPELVAEAILRYAQDNDALTTDTEEETA